MPGRSLPILIRVLVASGEALLHFGCTADYKFLDENQSGASSSATTAEATDTDTDTDTEDGTATGGPIPPIVGCELTLCADNPEIPDCVHRCEDDDTIAGCWPRCNATQSQDCWRPELECQLPAACSDIFCTGEPGDGDCVDRCEDDNSVVGCWYACEPEQNADCWDPICLP